MVLVDSSVWVDHFHRKDDLLAELLEAGEVLTHPLVIGELACHRLVARQLTLGLLHALPGAMEASADEVLALIGHARLWGRGLGVVDMHLLASARLNDARLWTRDKVLAKVATRLRLM